MEPGPYETSVVLKTLRDLNRRNGPVPARVVGDFLGKSERSARVYLRRLEAAGYVNRPNGARSGWKAG